MGCLQSSISSQYLLNNGLPNSSDLSPSEDINEIEEDCPSRSISLSHSLSHSHNSHNNHNNHNSHSINNNNSNLNCNGSINTHNNLICNNNINQHNNNNNNNNNMNNNNTNNNINSNNNNNNSNNNLSLNINLHLHGTSSIASAFNSYNITSISNTNNYNYNNSNNNTNNQNKDSLNLRVEDFIVREFLAKGGMGSVYYGIRKIDQLKVAFKFFGYDEKCPDMDTIQLEVSALTALRGLDGVVSFIGTFLDSASGILGKKAYKVWPKKYPVLVMPLLEGGALIDRIHVRSTVSENDLKNWFNQFIIGLGNIHLKGYIHRDIKLENIMLESMADDSPVRIIDFGLTVKMNDGMYTSQKISGTRGYHAPETLKWKQYSPKSDIWQAGCCLYSMLSGFSPFHPDNDIQTQDAKYFPMVGPVWSSISDRAKDLVSRILVADPEKRITISEILQHPWITSQASQHDLGMDYVARIKHLALRQKMKGFFLQNGIGETNKVRRGHLAEILPFLKPHRRSTIQNYTSINSDTPTKIKVTKNSSSTSLTSSNNLKGSEHGLNHSTSISIINPPPSPNSKHHTLHEKSINEFKNKLHIFQELVIDSFRTKYLRANGLILSPTLLPQHTLSKDDITTHQMLRSSQYTPAHLKLCIEYEEFVELMTKAGLEHLTERSVFNIFDITNTGGIDLKEFLLTMLAFQPEEENLGSLDTSSDRDLQTIRMYFQIFDFQGSGNIQLDDFKLAISCFLESRQSIPSSLSRSQSQDINDRFMSSNLSNNSNMLPSLSTGENIEELFTAIDTDKNGIIGFAEFQDFYHAILSSTSNNGLVASHA